MFVSQIFEFLFVTFAGLPKFVHFGIDEGSVKLSTISSVFSVLICDTIFNT